MPKRITSILLAVLLATALFVPALASEEPAEEPEIIAEETIEEFEEETGMPPEEEPAEAAEPVVEEPAADGIKVFGEDHASQYANGSAIELTDDYTLIVDCDKTLSGISGGETLTIRLQEGCTLTVNKPGGHGISVSTLYVSGRGTLVVNAGKDALNADVKIDLRNTNVVLTAGGDGIYCRDDIYIMDSSVKVNVEEDAVDLLGYLNIEGSDCTLTGGEYGVHSRAGRVTFTGSAIRAEGSAAGIYIPIGFLESDGALRVRSENSAAAYENFAIYTQGDIILKNGPVDVRGGFGGICSREGSILTVYCDMDIRAGYAAGILVPAGSVSIVGGEIIVQGNERGQNSGIYANAGIHAQGIGIGDGADVTAIGNTGLSASEYINIGAPTAAIGADWGLNIWSSNPSGHTRKISISDTCRASGSISAIQVNDGTISLLPACSIEVPEGGRIGKYQQVNTGILTSNGDVAKEVEIKLPGPELITRIDFTSFETELTPGAPFPYKLGDTERDSGCYNEARYWLDEDGRFTSGVPVPGRTYTMGAYILPESGYSFGEEGTEVPVYVNGSYLGDGTVEYDILGWDSCVRFTMEQSLPIQTIHAAEISPSASIA